MPRAARRLEYLTAGADFDTVVLAISMGAYKPFGTEKGFCAEIIARYARARRRRDSQDHPWLAQRQLVQHLAEGGQSPDVRLVGAQRVLHVAVRAERSDPSSRIALGGMPYFRWRTPLDRGLPRQILSDKHAASRPLGAPEDIACTPSSEGH